MPVAAVLAAVVVAGTLPWAQSANENGTFKSDEDLKELYAASKGKLQ